MSELEGRRIGIGEPSHVINIDIQDNHEEATIGAFMICDLCALVRSFGMLDITDNHRRLIDYCFGEL